MFWQITGTPLTGQVSQSAQWAVSCLFSGMKSNMHSTGDSLKPFNAQYIWANTSANLIIPDPETTILNPYKGGVFQQATSGVTETSENFCIHHPRGHSYLFKIKDAMNSSKVVIPSMDLNTSQVCPMQSSSGNNVTDYVARRL